MNKKYEGACDAKFRELERSADVVGKFAAFGTSSWVSLKNQLFDRSQNHLEFSQIDRKAFVSPTALRIIGMSILHYLGYVFAFRRRDLFIGAGSGVSRLQGRTMDAYMPAELSDAPGLPAREAIYFLSANHLGSMREQRAFLVRHRAVIYSLLVAPLKIALARVAVVFVKRSPRLRAAADALCAEMRSIGVVISADEILMWHARFCVGYLLFRILLWPLRIRNAFIVSAYSNSEMCAVLRKMGVRVTEIQHGIVGPTHRGYNYAVESSSLPAPDLISVYSEFWRGELRAAGFFSDARIVIGKRLKYQLAEQEQRAIAGPYVVFTGQGIMAPQIAQFCRQLVAGHPALQIVYVPHPSETAQFVAQICAGSEPTARIRIWNREDATTERLIIDSVAHVSVFSSCHFDAVHYKGKTFILDVLDDNLMNYYADRLPESFIRIRDAASLLSEVAESELR